MITAIDTQTIVTGAAVLVAAVVIVLVFRAMKSGGSKKDDAGENRTIDLTALDAEGPPQTPPYLEFYGTPVRLAVLVLAPSGRSQMPPKEKLRQTIDYLIPGLAQVLDSHQPIYRRWEGQLSTQGFAHSFFNNIALPGDRGKGTPWCSVVGKFDVDGGQLLAGLVCRGDKPNALGQVIVQHEGQWLDVLRVKESAT